MNVYGDESLLAGYNHQDVYLTGYVERKDSCPTGALCDVDSDSKVRVDKIRLANNDAHNCAEEGVEFDYQGVPYPPFSTYPMPPKNMKAKDNCCEGLVRIEDTPLTPQQIKEKSPSLSVKSRCVREGKKSAKINKGQKTQ